MANGKRHNLTNVRDSKGRLVESRQEIADVFASSYEELFASRRTSYPDLSRKVDCDTIPKVTAEEIKQQLQKMAKRKAGDARGIVIEMIQKGGQLLMEQLAELFSDILSPDKGPPDYWKEARLKVLSKKGYRGDPANYRPIAMLPILYKLFAKIVCGRVTDTLNRHQSVDQAGFRAGFSCDDHLFTMVQLVENMQKLI